VIDRRSFIGTLAGGLLATPLVAEAQRLGFREVGFLCSASSAPYAPFVAAFRHGLNEGGYVEGKNITIEFRWADGHYDRLPTLASDLVRRQVAVLVAVGGNGPVLAARAATATIPIVFASGGDPVRAGIVASLNRPGANVTGVNQIFAALVPKQLELLLQLVPRAGTISALVNPNYPDVELQRLELKEAPTVIKRPIHIVNAGSQRAIDAAFLTFVQPKTDALLVANDPFFQARRDQIVALAARSAIPAMYFEAEFAVAGGLISYGASLKDTFHEVGLYTCRILKGAKPADLPVEQPTKFELVINLKTAKALGLTIPPSLLQRADQVIE
jgi:putative ABC transport system substrate-binding protein